MKASVVLGLVLIAVGVVAFMFIGSGGSGNTVKVLDNLDGSPITGQTTSQDVLDSEETKEFTMTASDFKFSPEVIEVNEGDTVILHITSTDTDHGFSIPEFGVSQDLPINEQKTIQFVADKKGTYTFFCNVFCGSGHRSMKGSLVVN